RESKMIGIASLVCSSATSSGECDSDIISHDSPTSSIHVPTLEMSAAIHSARKSGSCSGAQADLLVGWSIQHAAGALRRHLAVGQHGLAVHQHMTKALRVLVRMDEVSFVD